MRKNTRKKWRLLIGKSSKFFYDGPPKGSIEIATSNLSCVDDFYTEGAIVISYLWDHRGFSSRQEWVRRKKKGTHGYPKIQWFIIIVPIELFYRQFWVYA